MGYRPARGLIDWSRPIRVFDFFSGCGGTSAGMAGAGMEIVLAIDNDKEASRTFQANFPATRVLVADIRRLPTRSLDSAVLSSDGHPILFSACAPCQPFSKQRKATSAAGDKRVGLLGEILRFIKRYRPELLFVENVPGVARGELPQKSFERFTQTIANLGYNSAQGVVGAQDYGVPQRRLRLILLASRLGPVGFPNPSHGPGSPMPRYSTVRDWIGSLPPLAAGTAHAWIPNHRAASLSPLNTRRLQATQEGGSWVDWPPHLIPNCHKDKAGGHSDVYGRMSWDAPSSSLTTRCISYSNGRFGHPDQDRAISVREAAALQTFPSDFVFTGSLNAQARQVGNAVPVLLARRFGEHLVQHVISLTARPISKHRTKALLH